MERIKYRGYEIGAGVYSPVGIFIPCDGYMTSTAGSVEEAKAKIDDWHAQWRKDADCSVLGEASRKAIADCGEEI